MKTVEIKILSRKLNHEFGYPDYATPGSAGMDLRSNEISSIEIHPGCQFLFNTGLWIALPDGYEAQVRTKSGLALNRSLIVLNSPGTIDSDYRGQIRVILYNAGRSIQRINPGDKIAQLVIASYVRAEWKIVEDLSSTERGEGGFGSTGEK